LPPGQWLYLFLHGVVFTFCLSCLFAKKHTRKSLPEQYAFRRPVTVDRHRTIGYLSPLSSSMENSPFDARNGSSFTPSPTPFPGMLALNLLIVHLTSQRSIRYENTHFRNVRTTTG
jgi:hypothetical protein